MEKNLLQQRRQDLAIEVRSSQRTNTLLQELDMYRKEYKNATGGVDLGMEYCFTSIYLETIVLNPQQINYKRLYWGLQNLESIRGAIPNTVIYPSVDAQLAVSSEQYCTKLAQFILGENEKKQPNQAPRVIIPAREQLIISEYAAQGNPIALLWSALFSYTDSIATISDGKRDDFSTAAKCIRKYLKIGKEPIPDCYYLPLILNSFNNTTQQNWDAEITPLEGSPIPGWQWVGDSVLAMLHYERESHVLAAQHLERSIEHIDEMLNASPLSQQANVQILKQGLQTALVRINKEVGRVAQQGRSGLSLEEDNNTADKAYSDVLKINSDDLEARLYLARRAFSEKDWAGAYDQFHHVTQLPRGSESLGKNQYVSAYTFAWHMANKSQPTESMEPKIQLLVQQYPQQKYVPRLILKIHQATVRGENLSDPTHRVNYFGYDPLHLSLLEKGSDSESRFLLNSLQNEIRAYAGLDSNGSSHSKWGSIIASLISPFRRKRTPKLQP